MEPFPPDLLEVLPEGIGPVAESWWKSLSESDRSRIAGLWDKRLEVCFFSPQADADGDMDDWKQIPTVRGGGFIPSDDDGRDEWFPGYFEHLLQHPELVLAYEPPRRTFHICTRHAAARACVGVGAVPVEFECPIGFEACPMLRLRGARLFRRCKS